MAWGSQHKIVKKLFQVINKAGDYTAAMQFRVKGLVSATNANGKKWYHE